jgi:hypothetical protein
LVRRPESLCSYERRTGRPDTTNARGCDLAPQADIAGIT